MRFFVLVAGTIAAVSLTGCVATAEIGAPATPPPPATLAPAPTAQVIIVQPPAAAAPARDDGLFVVAMVLMFGAVAAVGITAYLIGRISATPTQTPYSQGVTYQIELTPQELQAIEAWRARQAAQLQTGRQVTRYGR